MNNLARKKWRELHTSIRDLIVSIMKMRTCQRKGWIKATCRHARGWQSSRCSPPTAGLAQGQLLDLRWTSCLSPSDIGLYTRLLYSIKCSPPPQSIVRETWREILYFFCLRSVFHQADGRSLSSDDDRPWLRWSLPIALRSVKFNIILLDFEV